MKPTIPEGARVFVQHFRTVKGSSFPLTKHDAKKLGLVIDGKGGFTHVAIELPDGSITVGEAWCSKLDNYCKSKGRMIAIGRALKAVA